MSGGILVMLARVRFLTFPPPNTIGLWIGGVLVTIAVLGFFVRWLIRQGATIAMHLR